MFCSNSFPGNPRPDAKAAPPQDLKRLVTDALVARGLLYEGAIAHVTPGALRFMSWGSPEGSDTTEERARPPRGAPEAALRGFSQKRGVHRYRRKPIIVRDAKKGEFYAARIEKAGEATIARR